jgi:hypothetical protein
MNENAPILGWLVKTIGPMASTHYSRGHCLAGPRDFYDDIQFPVCPACNVENSPIMLIDFSDRQLGNSSLWDGLLLCIQCHNGCGMKDKHGWPNYWWHYGHPNAPKIIADDQIVKVEGRSSRDWQFESVEVDIVERAVRKTDRIETETRIGGEPAWLQDPFQQGVDILCIGCNRPMSMLFQWSETNMEYMPNGIGDSTGAIMGNPGISYWFGCRKCKIVGQIVEFG